MVRTHFTILLLLLLATGCSQREAAAPQRRPVDSLRLVLAPVAGTSALDRSIGKQQRRVEREPDSIPQLEAMGFLFVAKARRSFDPGYYKLAEACAERISELSPEDASGLFLRGHVLHSMHRFAEAGDLARRAVAARGSFLDHGLLGDVLLDQGDLREALAEYQVMLDAKPCLQSYSRAARVRWLRGDVEGARQLLELAVTSGSLRDPEPLCWVQTRLGELSLSEGRLERARTSADAALDILADYAPALRLRGRIDLADGNAAAAIPPLERAAALDPLPESRWTLLEGLVAAGRDREAADCRRALEAAGAHEDPRTYALYLLSQYREESARCAEALALAERELDVRHDVHTQDVHAWALHAVGRIDEARAAAGRATAEGTMDARILYHAGVIAAAVGDRSRATRLLADAHERRFSLLPSERADLSAQRAAL